ncbi:hypothetical protein [Chryseobacterium sp. VAUSW3]|uniref:hypothetical protein n=1 Tax=Chryseobacterium sp. VAUSW3 TaxID=2010998 RepID=UPI000B4C9F23|nr:hypothetical protein [Chryseobacterium sp. VAUSW3]OWR12869.1 hypothetical protein CDW55_12085 [Chryseobacterium sp. VAUSW3]
MKKNNYLIVLITLLVFSCKKESEKISSKLENNARIYLSTELTKEKDFEKIDSLRILKVDSLTEKQQANFYYGYLDGRFQRHSDLAKLNSDQAKLQMELSGLAGSRDNTVAKMHLEDSNKSLDSATYYENKMNKIFQNRNKYDSIKPKFLGGNFLLQVTNKNKTVKRDSIYLTFDLNGNIIDNNEMLKISNQTFK